MMPLRHSFFKLFNDSMSGPRCSWTRAAFSVVEEGREKWEKHLPPHVPDKSRERERERQRRIWWEEEQCVLWHGSMLQYSIQDVANWEQMRGGDTTGALWPGSTERQADQQMNTEFILYTCEDLVLFIPLVLYYNLYELFLNITSWVFLLWF